MNTWLMIAVGLILFALLCKMLMGVIYHKFKLDKKFDEASPNNPNDISGQFIVEAQHRLAPNLHGENK